MRFSGCAVLVILLCLISGGWAQDSGDVADDWRGDVRVVDGNRESDRGGPSRWFEIAVSYAGRTDESFAIERDYSVGGALLYRLKPGFALQAGVGVEKTDFEGSWTAGSGSSSMGEALVRLESRQEVLSPYALCGIGIRHYSFENKWGRASKNETGFVIGAGMAIRLTSGVFFDLAIRHEQNSVTISQEVVTYGSPPPDHESWTPSAGVPDAMLNPTAIVVQLRRELR